MTGVPSSDLRAYFEEARGWDHARLASALRSRRLAWIVAACASTLAGAAIAAVIVLTPLKTARSSGRKAGWRTLRGSAKGTTALKEHLAEHRREAKR